MSAVLTMKLCVVQYVGQFRGWGKLISLLHFSKSETQVRIIILIGQCKMQTAHCRMQTADWG